MQLSRLEWISSAVGLIAIVVGSAGYIIGLQKDVSTLERDLLDQKNEMAALKKKVDSDHSAFKKNITAIFDAKIVEIDKDKKELTALKLALEERYENKYNIRIGNLFDDAKQDLSDKKYKASVEKILKVLDKRPSDHEAYYYLSQAYRNDGKMSSALASINKAIEIRGPDDLYFYEKGMVFRDKRQYSKSIEFYKKSLSLNDANVAIYNSFRHVYHEMGDLENALVYANKYLEAANGSAPAYHLRGYTYKAMGDCNNATKDFKKTIELEDKQGHESHKPSAIIYMKECEKS